MTPDRIEKAFIVPNLDKPGKAHALLKMLRVLVRHATRTRMLRPHIARSVMMAARLGLERARDMTHALGLLGLPASIPSWTGHSVATNTPFEPSPHTISLAGERIALADAAASQWLKDVLAGGPKGALRLGSTLSFPIRAA